MRLVKRHPCELKRFRTWVLSGGPGSFERVVIEHEPNGSCCKREAWNDTAASIITALEPLTTQVLINLNRPEVETW
jgi:hypothetical protein